MKIGDIVYLTEPIRWRKTPDGSWDEYEYPIGTPLRIINDSPFRGYDLEFVENGIIMCECAFVKFSDVNPLCNETKENKAMNKNIDLVEVLKGHEGETFYSPLFGEVTLTSVSNDTNITYPINVRTCKSTIEKFTFYGSYYDDFKNSDCLLFPSKEQRDWNKWYAENRIKGPKTWSEYTKIVPPPSKTDDFSDYPYSASNKTFYRKNVTPVKKAALALIKIYQVIEFGYGGNVSDKEWADNSTEKFYISPRLIIETTTDYTRKTPIAFHTLSQVKKFASYPENVQLVKDYYNI